MKVLTYCTHQSMDSNYLISYIEIDQLSIYTVGGLHIRTSDSFLKILCKNEFSSKNNSEILDLHFHSQSIT